MAVGFGLPTHLLSTPSISHTSPVSPSTPVLPVLQAPSFAEFSFKSIGQPPRLLGRFTENEMAQDSIDDDNMSTSSDADQRLQNSDQNAVPRSRPSLWQVLADQDTGIATTHPANDRQAPLTFSPSIPVVGTFNSQGNVSSQHPVAPKGTFTQIRSPDSHSPVLSSSVHSHSASQRFISPTSNTIGEYIDNQRTDHALDSVRLPYPSANSDPNGGNDHVMEDTQGLQIPNPPSVPHSSRKYERLRYIHSRLRATLPSRDLPNLASAIVLTKSAQEKVATIHTEARRLHTFTQDILKAAQEGHATASALLKATEEAKGIADGAKSEVERILAAHMQPQPQIDRNELELDGLVKSLGDWISVQEVDEVAMRDRNIQQRVSKEQKGELAHLSTQPDKTSHPQVESAQSTAPLEPASSPFQRQRLFYSPTPEVKFKVNVESLSPPPPPLRGPPDPTNPTPDPSQRQAELRRILQSSERFSPVGAEEEKRLKEEEHGMDEEKRKEEERREEAERKAEDARRVFARQEAQRREHEAQERRVREEVEKKVREEKSAREEEEKKKAQQALEAMRKARADLEAEKRAAEQEAARKAQEEDARKRANEEAKQKVHEEEARRKAAEAYQQRIALLRQQQEAELQATLAAEAKQRRAKEKAEELKKFEEQQERQRAEEARQAKLREEQDKKRQQIQAAKDKSMADRAQQILAQRAHRPQPPPAVASASEMTLDSGPAVSKVAVTKPISPSNNSTGTVPASDSPPPTQPGAPQSTLLNKAPPLIQRPSPKQHADGLASTSTPLNLNRLSISQSGIITNGQHSLPTAPEPLTPTTRPPSLPPVACLSEPPHSMSPIAPTTPRSRQPALTAYRRSGDSGNIPCKENPTLSPQARAANLRHVVNALNLPPLNFSVVKTEVIQDDSELLYPPSGDENPQTQGPESLVQGARGHPSITQSQPVPLAAATASGHSLVAQPAHGSLTHTISDCHIPSSPAITDVPASVQVSRQEPSRLTEPAPSQIQKSVVPLSAPASKPSEIQQDNRHENVSSGLVQQQSTPPFPLQNGSRSRSQSPFRMGPDTFVPPSFESVADVRPDDGIGRSIPARPSYQRNRIESSSSAQIRVWDHYSPMLQRPRSPIRQADTYRPNYSEQSRSPPTQGRKRLRPDTPPLPGAPAYHDYRAYDEWRSVPRRRTRSPSPHPPARRPPPRRTPSPPEYSQNRPPLASRLAHENVEDSYRPGTSHNREREPTLLGRFTDARDPPASYSHGPPTRGGRGRGKRGRGGGNHPPTGFSHASLEERISSGSTLITRLEDPRRPYES